MRKLKPEIDTRYIISYTLLVATVVMKLGMVVEVTALGPSY